MKRQKSQVKEEKSPRKKKNPGEMAVNNLPNKEFKETIIRMFTTLEN